MIDREAKNLQPSLSHGEETELNGKRIVGPSNHSYNEEDGEPLGDVDTGLATSAILTSSSPSRRRSRTPLVWTHFRLVQLTIVVLREGSSLTEELLELPVK